MTGQRFSPAEREALLAVKGVGAKVIERFEQLGIHDLRQLATQDAGALCARAAALVGSSCWKNSPRARAAVAAAIERAARATGGAAAAAPRSHIVDFNP